MSDESTGGGYSLTADLAETALKLREHAESTDRILKVTYQPLVAPGENWLGVVFRMFVDRRRKDLSETQETYILKQAPAEPLARKFLAAMGYNVKERKMYFEVISRMEDFRRMYKVSLEPLWPKCVAAVGSDMLLLEDLDVLGYQKAAKNKLLDLDQTLMVVRSLAKFHALSSRLLKDSNIDIWTFERCGFITKSPAKVEFMKNKFLIAAKCMRTSWGKEWESLADQIETAAPLLIDHLNKICNRDEKNFNVLNHGDLWFGNVFFKYCEYSGNLIGVRFVDFQLSHYNSFAMDLQYLLWCSVEETVRRDHYDDILKAYLEALSSAFGRLLYRPENVPTFDEAKEEMSRKLLFGVVLSIYLVDLMHPGVAEDVPSLESLLKGGGFREDMFNTDAVRIKSQLILKPFINGNLFKIT